MYQQLELATIDLMKWETENIQRILKIEAVLITRMFIVFLKKTDIRKYQLNIQKDYDKGKK
jgi:hypothetical protein